MGTAALLPPNLALQFAAGLFDDTLAVSLRLLGLLHHPSVRQCMLVRSNRPVPNILREVFCKTEYARLGDLGKSRERVRSVPAKSAEF
jgi:hypothetical protein